MRIAFIVQRYGAEILGGSEFHCRMVAERVAEKHDVDVLTSCAVDYLTWKNEYQPGEERVRGVTIRRFPTTEQRDIDDFNRYSDWIFHYPHTVEDEMEWVRKQGPWCPGLLEYLEKHEREYDALVFFTYLYAPTVLGLRINPAKSVLVPTAHDEPAIHLSIYKQVFSKPAAIAFNTDIERHFLQRTFEITAPSQEIVGCGVDLPEASLADMDREGQTAKAGPPLKTPSRDEQAAHVTERGAGFRRRHRLHGPIALYGGRIEAGKGCEELFEYFASYVKAGGDATLALMGVKLMPLPEEPWVRFAGRLSDAERAQALEAATVIVVPSPYESLSLLALESFAVGTPILANARSEVLVDHCRMSNAGLYYSDRDEFVECLKMLMTNSRLRETMGRNGREYVRKNYRWDVILSKYERFFSAIRGR